MKRSVLLVLIYIGCASVALAGPVPGQYSGVLKLTKSVYGLSLQTQVRALAAVGEDGKLTVVVVTRPDPIPTLGVAKDGFQTVIQSDDSCVIPLPSGASSLPGGAIPEFRGLVEVRPNGFSLEYDDVPERYVDSNGNPVNVSNVWSPVALEQFRFVFRRTKGK